MRLPLGAAALVALALGTASCSDSGPTSPTPTPIPSGTPRLQPSLAGVSSMPAVRISEFHYDNSGTDAGEAIEVSGPAATDLAGWSIVLYNGNGGAPYDTDALTGTIADLCGGRGVVVLNYPSNGIQNGSPDGIALVDAAGQVVEFLSYEGTITAVGGPADGTLSADIGVSQNGSQTAGGSLERNASNGWAESTTHSFGACNDDGDPEPPAVVARVSVSPETATISQGTTQQFTASAFDAADEPITNATFVWSSSAPEVASVDANGLATGLAVGEAQIIATAPSGASDASALEVTAALPPSGLTGTRFSEIHYDNDGTDSGEAIEIEGPAGTVLTGATIVLYNGSSGAPYDTDVLSGVIPDLCDGRGVVVLNYPSNGIQNGSPDAMALVDADGQVVEFLSYEGTLTGVGGPADGMVSIDIGVDEPASSPSGRSLQRNADGTWHGPATASFGACNPPGGTTPGGGSISFFGRSAGEPPLPVGFQDQLFANVRDGSGAAVTTPVIWSSETPAIASIDEDGVMTARAAGTATFRATATDGTTATYSLPTTVAVASSSAQYVGNTEFGEPADADASDDLIVRRAQYTASWNPNRGTPNWVSFNLEATHFGPEDRCDCFTFDPELSGMPSYTTADYTGAGEFHGHGIDRGHMARSFDRTAASLDNATTYYFTNIIPQTADQNQGPWSALEFVIGDFARTGNREVYVVTGVAGSKGTIKNEGKITIPASVWKVAVIMTRNEGLDDIDGYEDFELIAVNMPNEPGIRDVSWETYKTSVDAIEALTGYDLLALLPDHIERVVETGTKPPVAAHDGPYASMEGSTLSLSAAASSDPDGDAITYAWTFGDGATGDSRNESHRYAQDGVYTVRLIVTDTRGFADTAETTATVANVAPVIGAFAGAVLLPGETYGASGSFTDPGADAWTAAVNYGDGSGVGPLALAGKGFTLSHTYASAGSFTVAVDVSDDDATSTQTASVTVLSHTQAVQNATALVNGLIAGGTLSAGNGNSLLAKLAAAEKSIGYGNTIAGASQLQSLLNELDAMIQSGRVAAADVAALRELVSRLIRSL